MHQFDFSCNRWEFVDFVGHPTFSVCGVESVIGMVGLVGWGRAHVHVCGLSKVVPLLVLVGQGGVP